MPTRLEELIKEGHKIKNNIYADNGGGIYATYLFGDHNQYIKWAISSIKYIEDNFTKDDNYIKFKETIEIIDKNVTPTEFNKLLFILEYYNVGDEEGPKQENENILLKEVLDSIKAILSGNDYNELEEAIDRDNESQAKEIIIKKLNILDKEKLSDILASILIKLKK